MVKGFKFLPDVAIADIAIEARGGNLNEVFEAAAEGLFETMAKVDTVDLKISKEISLEAGNVNDLLYDFLSEIVYLKDTEGMVFGKVEVEVDEEKCELKGVLFGDKINKEKQELVDDVKAITMHMFDLKKEKEGYKAIVVVDI